MKFHVSSRRSPCRSLPTSNFPLETWNFGLPTSNFTLIFSILEAKAAGVGRDVLGGDARVLAAVQRPPGVDGAGALAPGVNPQEGADVRQFAAGPALDALAAPPLGDRQHGRERPLDPGPPGISLRIDHPAHDRGIPFCSADPYTPRAGSQSRDDLSHAQKENPKSELPERHGAPGRCRHSNLVLRAFP